jgi:hypothetical protein
MSFNLDKRLGDDEEDGPGILIGLKTKSRPKPINLDKRLGDSEDSTESSDEGGSTEELIQQAAEGLCKEFNISRTAASRVANYITTICNACDSLPHKEGEHAGESEE